MVIQAISSKSSINFSPANISSSKEYPNGPSSWKEKIHRLSMYFGIDNPELSYSDSETLIAQMSKLGNSYIGNWNVSSEILKGMQIYLSQKIAEQLEPLNQIPKLIKEWRKDNKISQAAQQELEYVLKNLDLGSSRKKSSKTSSKKKKMTIKPSDRELNNARQLIEILLNQPGKEDTLSIALQNPLNLKRDLYIAQSTLKALSERKKITDKVKNDLEARFSNLNMLRKYQYLLAQTIRKLVMNRVNEFIRFNASYIIDKKINMYNLLKFIHGHILLAAKKSNFKVKQNNSSFNTYVTEYIDNAIREHRYLYSNFNEFEIRKLIKINAARKEIMKSKNEQDTVSSDEIIQQLKIKRESVQNEYRELIQRVSSEFSEATHKQNLLLTLDQLSLDSVVDLGIEDDTEYDLDSKLLEPNEIGEFSLAQVLYAFKNALSLKHSLSLEEIKNYLPKDCNIEELCQRSLSKLLQPVKSLTFKEQVEAIKLNEKELNSFKKTVEQKMQQDLSSYKAADLLRAFNTLKARERFFGILYLGLPIQRSWSSKILKQVCRKTIDSNEKLAKKIRKEQKFKEANLMVNYISGHHEKFTSIKNYKSKILIYLLNKGFGINDFPEEVISLKDIFKNPDKLEKEIFAAIKDSYSKQLKDDNKQKALVKLNENKLREIAQAMGTEENNLKQLAHSIYSLSPKEQLFLLIKFKLDSSQKWSLRDLGLAFSFSHEQIRKLLKNYSNQIMTIIKNKDS